MRLLEAYVDNFGVLHDYHVRFDQGLHVICASNGSGKTTFAAFLQAMFYGMPGSIRRELDDNPRKKYLPWQGGTFGGWVEVETARGVYRIARTFASRPKDDIVSLTDARTGRKKEIPPEGIGQMLFGLDEDSYARSVFLSQREDIVPGDTLHGQLRTLLEGDENPAAYTDAMRRLESARKSLQPFRGSGGRIAQLEQQISDVGRQWADASARAQSQDAHSRTLSDLQHKLTEAHTRRAECKTALTQAHRAAGGREELRRQLAEAEAFFPDGVPSEGELVAAETAIRGLENESAAVAARHMPSAEECSVARGYAQQAREAQDALDGMVLPPEVYQRGKELESHFQGEMPSLSTVSHWEKQANLLLKYRNQQFLLILFGCFAAGLSLFSGGMGGYLWYRREMRPAWIALGLCAVLLLAAGGLFFAITRPRKKIRFLHRLLTPVQEKYNPELPPEDAALEAAELRGEWEQIKEQVRRLKEARNQQAVIRDEAMYALDAFFHEYGRPEGTPEQAIAALRMQSAGQWGRDGAEDGAFLENFWSKYSPHPNPENPRAALQQIRTMWDRLQHTRAAFEKTDAACEAESDAQTQLDEANGLVVQLTEEFRKTQQRLDEAREAQCAATELSARHAALREELQHAEHQRNLLDRTIMWMREAQDQLSVQYLTPMRTRFLSYFQQMFGSDASELTIDPNLRISWTQAGGERSMACFSAGTQAAAAVCLRLAMIDLLFRQERPMLILDDPFVHLDDARLAQAMQVLTKLSEHTQILYFTCHSSRRDVPADDVTR